MVCPTGLLQLLAGVALMITPGSGIAQTASQSATCAKALREAAAEDQAVGNMLDAEARYQETHGGELSPALFDESVKWHSPKSAQDPDRYPPLLRRQLSPVDQLKRRFAIEDFMQDYMQEVRDGMDARKARVARACPGRKVTD